MQIKFLNIKNFKSIRELEIRDVENCLILVGKNNTGKTVVLDAIRAVTGNYKVRETDFNERRQNIEITMTLQITEEDVPVTLSHDLVTGLLREQMGFQDIIITDSMSMQAITDYYSAGDAAVKAVQAGVDMILMPQNLQESVNGILSAVENGVITEERINESVLRILQVKISQGIIEIENQEM